MMPSKPAAGAKPAGGGSAASLAEARRDLDKVLKADQALAAPLADELFALVDALDADAALPRALTNPNRAAGPKELLVRRAMAGHRPAAVALAARVATLRWSKEGDLADALEELAFAAALSAAATDSTRRALEAELFQVDAVLANNRDLRTALGDAAAKPAARAKLARAVFAPSLSPLALRLVERVVTHPRGRGVRSSLAYLGGLVAALRHRSVAVITAAAPLTPLQEERLVRTLEAAYGRAIQLNITYDNTVLGGLKCRVGDELVDGSVFTRFADVRRELAA